MSLYGLRSQSCPLWTYRYRRTRRDGEVVLEMLQRGLADPLPRDGYSGHNGSIAPPGLLTDALVM